MHVREKRCYVVEYELVKEDKRKHEYTFILMLIKMRESSRVKKKIVVVCSDILLKQRKCVSSILGNKIILFIHIICVKKCHAFSKILKFIFLLLFIKQ